jgi:hypothetical protein
VAVALAGVLAVLGPGCVRKTDAPETPAPTAGEPAAPGPAAAAPAEAPEPESPGTAGAAGARAARPATGARSAAAPSRDEPGSAPVPGKPGAPAANEPAAPAATTVETKTSPPAAPQAKPNPAKPTAQEAAAGVATPTTTGTTATKPAPAPDGANAGAPAAKPTAAAKSDPAKPPPVGKPDPATKSPTPDQPATAKAAGAGAKPAAAASPEPAAVAKADAGAAAKPGKAVAPTKPAPQAAVVTNTPALNVEAEQLARRDAGPGPDYANAPRRAKGGSGNTPPPEPPPPTKAIPGGPLAIPGSKVDFESKRVERFMEEGGTTLAGRVLDADSGKGVDDAGIEAWMGTRSIHADSDESGAFRFDGMKPGSRVTLWITATQKYVQERIEVVIPADKPRLEATFKLLPRASASGHAGGIGVFLSRRGGHTVISGLDAFGPAERAGLTIGDAIVAIGKRNVSELGPGAIEYLLRGTIGEDVEISVASNDAAARKVTLKRAGR